MIFHPFLFLLFLFPVFNFSKVFFHFITSFSLLLSTYSSLILSHSMLSPKPPLSTYDNLFYHSFCFKLPMFCFSHLFSLFDVTLNRISRIINNFLMFLFLFILRLIQFDQAFCLAHTLDPKKIIVAHLFLLR